METFVTPWAGSAAPTKEALLRLMKEESLDPYSWSNGPLDQYPAHRHAYGKVIYVVTGTITFGLPREGMSLWLNAGDRLDLPAGTVHDAQVGSEGVECLEAHHG